MSRNNQFTVDLGNGIVIGAKEGIDIEQLNNVVVSGISTGQHLEWNGNNWVNATPPSGGGGGTYTNTTPVITPHGGVPVNQTFNAMAISDVLDLILYPYVAIQSNSLTADISNSLREKGNSITATINFTSNYTIGSVALVDIDFQRNNISQQKTASNTWSETTDITDTTTFKAIVNDGTSTPQSTITYSFVYPFYYGVGAAGLTTAQIRTNFGATVTNAGDKVYSFAPTNQVYYFAYPASYGTLIRVLDWNGFDITADFTLRTENITGLDTAAISYYIYEFNNLVTHTAQNLTFDT